MQAYCKLGPVCPEGYIWMPPSRSSVTIKKIGDDNPDTSRDIHSGLISLKNLKTGNYVH